MKKKTLLAYEVEKELNKMREENGITNQFEKKYVEEKVADARRTGKNGDIVSMVVDPLYLHVPSWQRPCDITRARAIGEEYNVDCWDEPKVLYDKGKLWTVDGMHRTYGAALTSKKFITVRLMSENATEKMAMEVFIHQTDLIKKMSIADKIKAGVSAGIPEYVLLDKICRDNKVCLIREDFEIGKHVGTFTSLRDGLELAESNPKLLDDILKIIGKLHWNGETTVVGKAYGARSFRVIRALFSYYENFRKELEEILIKYCSGSEFWENNLDKRSQAQLFDFLSNIVNRYLPSENVVAMSVNGSNGNLAVVRA